MTCTRASGRPFAYALMTMVALPLAAATQDPLADPGGAGAPSGDSIASGRSENPFSGFETWVLENGLKVWFKHLEGAPNVSVSVVVPYGADRDPEGKEQLAHFTEHMLFSDHDGKTEQEIKDAVEALGGNRNGVTTPDRTWYYVTIARQHGPFAIRWLSRILSPHAMEPEVVDRGRQPLAVEIDARPREFFEHVLAALDPAWLSPPGFWEREFGLETRRTSYDRWASLQRITPDDLSGFYDRYYAPGAMTLTIVGDLDPAETRAIVSETFATLPEREVAPKGYTVSDPGRGRASYSWGFGSDVSYQERYKFFAPTADDQLRILFVEDLLRRRLNQRLRYGERKAVYGLQVSLVRRGPAMYLSLSGDINEEEYDFAVQVLEEELDVLRSGTLDPATFEEDRRALVESLRTDNLTAQSLSFWSTSQFYDRDVFADFPDVLGFYESVTQEDLARFASANLVPERRLLSIVRLQPVSQVVAVLAGFAVILLAHRLVSRAFTRPIRMREIRYVARFKLPLVLRVARTVVFVTLGLALARLLIAALDWAGIDAIGSIDNYVVQHVLIAAVVVAVVALLLAYLGAFPRKVLVFGDHVRIKSRAYRSRALAPADVAEISLRRFPEIWLSPRLLGCSPLTFGLVRPGIYLKPKRGRSYFFRTRDTGELAEVLQDWARASAEHGTTPEPVE